MSDQIEQVRQRTYRYYYQDGLVELAVGFLFAVIGLDTWLINITAEGTAISLALWILLPLLTIGGVFGVQRIVRQLKERWVYPRTGYVEYSTKPNPYRWLVIAAALLLAVATFVLPYQFLDKMSVLGGVILFIILVAIGAQVNLTRLVAIGALALLAGFAFAFFTAGEIVGLTLTFIVTGAALMLSGGLALRNYLDSNPLHEEAANG